MMIQNYCIGIFVSLYTECVDKRFGRGTMVKERQVIRRKCNKKCIDVADEKVKKEVKEEDK